MKGISKTIPLFLCLYFHAVNTKYKLPKSGTNIMVSEIITVNIILPNESKNFKTFPNPFESVIKVNFNEPLTKLAKLHLFNSIGTMVKEWTTNQQENSFDILELPNGVYILKCEINGKIEAVKLVKN